MSGPQLHGEPLQGCRATSSFLFSCYQEPASQQDAANKQSKRHKAMSQQLAHKGPKSTAPRGSTTVAETPLETIPSFHWGSCMLTLTLEEDTASQVFKCKKWLMLLPEVMTAAAPLCLGCVLWHSGKRMQDVVSRHLCGNKQDGESLQKRIYRGKRPRPSDYRARQDQSSTGTGNMNSEMRNTWKQWSLATGRLFCPHCSLLICRTWSWPWQQ